MEEWRYFIAAVSTKEIDDTLEEYVVPPFTWAIFSGEGQCPQAIQELEKRIVTEWLPTSGYEYDNGPDIEVYLNPDPQNARFEVWIPVIKKNNQEGILDRTNENFNVFLKAVDDRYKDFVIEINDYLTQNNCKCEIKPAKKME